jgi:hypothetical protein
MACIHGLKCLQRRFLGWQAGRCGAIDVRSVSPGLVQVQAKASDGGHVVGSCSLSPAALARRSHDASRAEPSAALRHYDSGAPLF